MRLYCVSRPPSAGPMLTPTRTQPQTLLQTWAPAMCVQAGTGVSCRAAGHTREKRARARPSLPRRRRPPLDLTVSSMSVMTCTRVSPYLSSLIRMPAPDRARVRACVRECVRACVRGVSMLTGARHPAWSHPRHASSRLVLPGPCARAARPRCAPPSTAARKRWRPRAGPDGGPRGARSVAGGRVTRPLPLPTTKAWATGDATSAAAAARRSTARGAICRKRLAGCWSRRFLLGTSSPESRSWTECSWFRISQMTMQRVR